MKVVRPLLLLTLAIAFSFLAIGSFMAFSVFALPFGLIFAALSLSSAGMALQEVFERHG